MKKKKKKNLANTQALNKLHHIISTQNMHVTASRLHTQQLPNNVHSGAQSTLRCKPISHILYIVI